MLDRHLVRRLVRPLACALLVLGAGATSLQARPGVEAAPPGYLARTDGHLELVTPAADGSVWAAWSYRQGAEFDIALARRDPDTGFWSAPQFLGLADGADQVEPALVADPAGNLYLAYAESGRILLTTRPAGSDGWTLPVSIAPGRHVVAPALRILGDRLVVAFRHGAEIEIHDVPLLPVAFRGSTIHDAPDPVIEGPSSSEHKGETGSENPNYDGSDAPTDSATSSLAQDNGSQGKGKRSP